MNRFFSHIVLLAILMPLTACAQSNVNSNAYNMMLKSLLDHSVPEVNVADLEQDSTSYIYLDAREKNEFDVSRVADAVWVGYDDFKIERVEQIDKDSPIIVYCSVGYRSEKVTEKLLAEGFTNVSNLYGGIFEWKNQGNSVVDENGAETEDVHAYSPNWGIWLKKGNKVY